MGLENPCRRYVPWGSASRALHSLGRPSSCLPPNWLHERLEQPSRVGGEVRTLSPSPRPASLLVHLWLGLDSLSAERRCERRTNTMLP